MAEDTQEKTTESTASRFSLRVTEDKMAVLLSCLANDAKDEAFFDEILARLKEMKVAIKPDGEEVGRAINKAKETGEDIVDLPIIKGTPPLLPEDGRLEWTGEYFKQGYYIDPETKRIDFRQKAGDPSVENGQLLVKVYKARKGKDGRNVFGKKIIVPRPKEVNLKGGPNVYWDEKDGGFKANCSGTTKLRGRTLNVDPVRFVAGGVGIESGNIKHNGEVIVDGDVETDFKIEATGNIDVRGLIYPCEIICGGNLISKEGIIGNLSRGIKLEGDICAKYIQNATIKSGGNIVANTEIFQCNIRAKGEVNCNEGRIVGGEVSATKGITVGQVGYKGNVKTIVIAGVDLELQAKMKANTDEIVRLKEMIKKLEAGYRKFKSNMHLLNDTQKETMTEIDFKIHEGEEEIKKLEDENKDIFSKIRDNADAKITILDTVYPGVSLRISHAYYVVDQTLTGPIVAGLDRIKGEIVLTSDIEDKSGE